MTQRFNTYKKKTTLYYVLQSISILTMAFLLWAWAIDLQIDGKWYKPVVFALIALGIFTIAINLILTASNFVLMYKKDGELIVDADNITFNDSTIPIKKIKKIEIRATDYRGARASDGSGNRITITSDSGTIATGFVIKSKEQLNDLKGLLSMWKEQGIDILD